MESGTTCQLIVIPGKPIPFDRPRPHFKKPGFYIHPERYREWLESAKRTIMSLRPEQYEGPVLMEVVALFPRPTSWPKSRGFDLEWRDVVPDLDNLMKAGLDAGNGFLYEDDKQVVRLAGAKLYSKGRNAMLALHVSNATKLPRPWGLSMTPCSCWERLLEQTAELPPPTLL